MGHLRLVPANMALAPTFGVIRSDALGAVQVVVDLPVLDVATSPGSFRWLAGHVFTSFAAPGGPIGR